MIITFRRFDKKICLWCVIFTCTILSRFLCAFVVCYHGSLWHYEWANIIYDQAGSAEHWPSQALAHLEVKQWWCEVHLFRFMPLTVSDIDVCMSPVTFPIKKKPAAHETHGRTTNYLLDRLCFSFACRSRDVVCTLVSWNILMSWPR